MAAADFFVRRLPNILLAAAFIPATFVLIVDHEGLLGSNPESCIFGAFLSFGLTAPGYFWGKLGAGDVKYAGILGLIAGFKGATFTLTCAAVVLGIMSALALMWRAVRNKTVRRLPAGVALSVGFAVYLLFGDVMSVIR